MSQNMENIKNLREMTGAGFLDCKKALEENSNDIEKSVTFLRKKGLAKASKKSTRSTNEGAIGIYSNEAFTVMLEVNTETDFAAKNETFLNFLDTIGNFSLQVENIEDLSKKDFLNKVFNSKKISEHFTEIIAKIGENIVLRRLATISNNNNTKTYTYIHNPYKSNIGKICVMLNAKINENNDETKKFGKNLCMHIAASKPLALNIENLDNSLIQKEKDVQLATIQSSGKPENIINKILEGKMNKYYSEVILLNQPYILDTDNIVKKVIEDFSAKNLFEIIKYEIFVLGS